jgi:DNA-directed RNA polymerase specialized sigma24 family protein
MADPAPADAGGVHPPAPDTDPRLEERFREAWIHLSRYFRRWLADVPESEELADALAAEALLRLARSGALHGGTGPDGLAAECVRAAHEFASEILG